MNCVDMNQSSLVTPRSMLQEHIEKSRANIPRKLRILPLQVRRGTVIRDEEEAGILCPQSAARQCITHSSTYELRIIVGGEIRNPK